MPIYEYRCASCARDFELTRPISQSSEPGACPNCGKPSPKLVSSFASKADYTVKVPTKEPFRAPMAAAGNSAGGAAGGGAAGGGTASGGARAKGGKTKGAK